MENTSVEPENTSVEPFDPQSAVRSGQDIGCIEERIARLSRITATVTPISRSGTITDRISRLEDAYDHCRKEIALLQDNIFTLFSSSREATDDIDKVNNILRSNSLWDPTQ